MRRKRTWVCQLLCSSSCYAAMLLFCYAAILRFCDSAIPVLLCTLYYGCFPTVEPLYTCVGRRGRNNRNQGQEQARGERAGPWGGSFVVER